MVLKTILSLEVEKEGRLYQFNMPVGANYDEIYTVMREIRGEILDLAKKAELKARADAEKTRKEEEAMKKEDGEKKGKEDKKRNS